MSVSISPTSGNTCNEGERGLIAARGGMNDLTSEIFRRASRLLKSATNNKSKERVCINKSQPSP